jgi:hypothetical protein
VRRVASLSLTSRMDEETGYLVFTALQHVPLYALLLWGLLGLEFFFIVHVLLHLAYGRHPEYRFGSAFSLALILGAGALGALDLLTLL